MKVNIGRYPKKDNKRKIDIHIDPYDTYSADHTLALIILPILLQFKQEKHGVPSEFADVGGEDYAHQMSFDFYQETHSESFDESCKKWDDILDHMIWAFMEIAKDDYQDKYHHGHPDFNFVKDQVHPTYGQLYRMNNNNPDYWVDYDGIRLHEERIQQGIDLFAKYYKNLWD